MKQVQSTPVGEAARVRRVAAPARPGSAYHVVGELNIGGMPCEVLYRGGDSPVAGAVSHAGFQVRSDGSVVWEQPTGGNGTRALARQGDAYSRGQISVEPIPTETALAQTGGGGGDLEKVHRLLRGRYFLAALFAIAFGALGAWLGLRSGYQTFQSTGLITIVPVHLFPRVDNADTVDQFIEAQATKFGAQRVLLAALEDPDWAKLQRPRSNEDDARFARQFEVTRKGQMLLVKFTDRDPAAAELAVQTAMNAFMRNFAGEQADDGNSVQARLEDARTTLKSKLTRVQQDIDTYAMMYGPEGLELERTFKLEQRQELQRVIHDCERAQADVELAHATATTRPAARLIPVDEIARTDTLMQTLLARRTQLQDDLTSYDIAGMLPENQKVKAARALLAHVQGEIDHRANDWREMHEDHSVVADAPTMTMTPEQISRRMTYCTARLKDVEKDLKDLSDRIGSIGKLKIERDRIQRDLGTAEETLQQNEVEKTKWQLQLTPPDKPLTPYRDTRVTFAAAGGFGGVALGVGLTLLLGLMDRRIRGFQDAKGHFARDAILGILPQLPEDLADPEQAAAAAHAVHEIRTLLQIWGRGRNHRVFGITSPAAGSGKTSLTVALGVSFATAGFRTLVVDCDLVGGGLTSRIDALIRRRIGQILIRGGHLTEAQLQEALKLANDSERRLGDVLVELGHVSEESLTAALAIQSQEPVGLLDALGGDDLEDCIAEAGIVNLSILPLGRATAQHAGTLSTDALARVIQAARERFDVVLVDTGPVPGSLEASITASQVDAVVLTVARGDKRPNVERAAAHLRSLGTRLAGIVFNRAHQTDVELYGSSRLSSSGRTSSGAGADRRMTEEPESVRLGPIGRAVASFAPGRRDGGSRRGE